MQEIEHVLAEVEPRVRLGVDLAQPAAARLGAGWLLAAVEPLVAPEAFHHVHADVADVVGVLHVVPGGAQDIADRDAEHRVPQVADVEGLVRIRLGVLDHHRLGDGRALPVLRTARQHLADERGGDGIAVECDVDVAVDGLDRGEKGIAGGGNPCRDLLGQDRHALAHRARGQRLGFLLGEAPRAARSPPVPG